MCNDNVKFVDLSSTNIPINIPENYDAVWNNSGADIASILYRPQSEIALHAKIMLI